MEFIKRNIKWIILVIILMVIVSGVSVYATTTYLASQVNYTKQNGKTITVSEALNDLYNKKNSDIKLIWENPNPTEVFNEQTVELDLSNYEYVIVVLKHYTDGDTKPRGVGILKVNDSIPNNYGVIQATGTFASRESYATKTGIWFSLAHIRGVSDRNNEAIPLYIYGFSANSELDSALGY